MLCLVLFDENSREIGNCAPRCHQNDRLEAQVRLRFYRFLPFNHLSLLQVKNIKIEREMDVHLQFLLCGYNGSGYSSLISVEKQVRDEVKVFNRILINAGDGTQRICSENRIKLFAVSTIIITSLCPQNLSGFSGVFLSLSDLVLSFLLFSLIESSF